MATNRNRKLDLILLAVILLVMAGLPIGIWSYDRQTTADKVPPGARQFTLTGHAERGWVLGEVPAYGAVSFFRQAGRPVEKPVIEVRKGDIVVLKLTSSDVLHGFSLKDFGVYLAGGIQPGKVTYVTFTADKAGTFTFSCNAICGDRHENMQGVLVVRA